MAPSRELAIALLQKAGEDLAMARRLAGDPSLPAWGAGFHVQQAVEKAIKAVLALRGVEYPRTHNIAILLDLVRDRGLVEPPLRDSLVLLTPFGVLFRYDEMGPSDVELRSLPAATTMLRWAAEVLAWAENLIRPAGTG